MLNNFDINDYKIKHIHLIGIGGISMSAIAEVLLNQGYAISGSDLSDSKLLNRLREKGAEIFIGHSAQNVKNPDLIVYSAAIKENNPERMEGKKLGITEIDRAEMLGQIMKKYNKSIAVSGSHGKTTTTSLVSLLMEYSSLDPTILVGGELDEIGGNIKIGQSQHFITEACEYVESFLKFNPFIAIILNIDEDHLDYFKDLEHIKSSFRKFAVSIPKDGFLIANWDDENVRDISTGLSCNILTYSISGEGDFKAKDIEFTKEGLPIFYIEHLSQTYGPFKLSIPGKHNVYNALAAITTLSALGVEIDRLKEYIPKYKGIHRRFDLLGEVKGAKIVDDYAHHPAEIKATLEAAKNYPHNKLWCIFQPHTYTRTKTLLEDFAQSFTLADYVIIADIYAAREQDTGEITSLDLVNKINDSAKVSYISGFDNIAKFVYEKLEAGDLVLTMGAGDIYKVGQMLLDKNKTE